MAHRNRIPGANLAGEYRIGVQALSPAPKPIILLPLTTKVECPYFATIFTTTRNVDTHYYSSGQLPRYFSLTLHQIPAPSPFVRPLSYNAAKTSPYVYFGRTDERLSTQQIIPTIPPLDHPHPYPPLTAKTLSGQNPAFLAGQRLPDPRSSNSSTN